MFRQYIEFSGLHRLLGEYRVQRYECDYHYSVTSIVVHKTRKYKIKKVGMALAYRVNHLN